ncbi:MAG: hypothetical protein GC200_03895 [Tepidisphaera sp.]|nr:hypothetical protein [Tepidisphaera sp.]
MHKPIIALSLAAFAAAAQAQSLENLYKNSCVVCHAADGHGGGAGATTFNTKELFDESHDRPFFDTIKNGNKEKGMPAFGATLSNAQIWGLVVHIRELQSQALRKDYGSPHPDTQGVYTSQHAKFKLETLVPKGKLDVPWAIDFFPDSAPDSKYKSPATFIVTEREGNVRLGHADGSLSEPLTGTPAVRPVGQGGMLDVTVHPDFPSNGYVYLSFSDPDTPAKKNGMTKIVRGRVDLSDPAHPAWTDQQTIFEAKKEHYLPTAIHFGSRIVFTKPIASGPDQGKRYVFFSIGERGHMEMAQDTSRPNGKIHRLFDDGSLPSDNPFPSGPYPSIWTFGHRNPQALTIDLDGRLWETEHGPRGGDELNLIDARGKKNYGWPTLCYGINYNGSAFDTPWPDVVTDKKAADTAKDLVPPVSRWLPSIATCGMDCMRPGPKGEAFPAWRNDLFAGGLAGQTLQRIRTKDGKLIEREEILQGMGRVRDVQTGPDGSLYLVLNEPDEIVRLVPAE